MQRMQPTFCVDLLTLPLHTPADAPHANTVEGIDWRPEDKGPVDGLGRWDDNKHSFKQTSSAYIYVHGPMTYMITK